MRCSCAGAERCGIIGGRDPSTLDRTRLAALLADEHQRFVDLHPRSAAKGVAAVEHLLGGVPMPWMTWLPGAFPLFFTEAHGARFVDADGIEYIDFCLGDTGAMAGHALPQVADALAAQSDVASRRCCRTTMHRGWRS
ncbi:MAG: hypothetical protein R2713_05335 [Ilumatobacteraceae bacterium]